MSYSEHLHQEVELNPRIIKITQEIEKTKAKISELQILLPELEQRKTTLENEEIIRRVRKASASARLEDLEIVLEAIKQPEAFIEPNYDSGVIQETDIDESPTYDSTHQHTQEPDETGFKD